MSNNARGMVALNSYTGESVHYVRVYGMAPPILLKCNSRENAIIQREQKSHIDQRGECLLDFDFQCEYEL